MNSGSLSAKLPRVSIVLLNCNRNDDTLECIRSLKQTGDKFNIILVDNGSQPTPENLYKRAFPDVVFLRNEQNLGTPIGNNVGIRYALKRDADYVMMLNNDTVVRECFLSPLLRVMEEDPTIGVAGGKVYFYSDPKRIWFAGGKYSRITTRSAHIGILKLDHEVKDAIDEPDFISGCYALFRSSVLKKIGLLDEQFFAYMEDADLCLRIKQNGFRLRYVPEAVILHKVSTTIKIDSPFYLYFNMRNKILMLRKHCSFLERFGSIPYLSFYYGRQLIRLAVKWRYWAGVEAVLFGIHDGLRGYTGRLGKGRLDQLHE